VSRHDPKSSALAVVTLLLSVRDDTGESGALHRELERFGGGDYVNVLATFPSADGQPRLVAGSGFGRVRVDDPEAGAVLHRLVGHVDEIKDLACIASSSAAPHHPHLVSASHDRTAKVWDGETGEMLADLPGRGPVKSVAVWKEHTGGHDRIATADVDCKTQVWDAEAFTLLHDLRRDGDAMTRRVSAFQSAEGPARLLVMTSNGHGVQVGCCCC
jgi:WD40 repeat protein